PLTCHDGIWNRRVGQVLTVILNDAVQLTTQYLLLWAESLHVSAPRATQILRYSQTAFYATMKVIAHIAGNDRLS
ncbi:MAG TPA: hypothetical protein VHL11_18840, partial [Phototrophicaceae bacterium]|nr:hypothetical protein [Phototrophicaceae bacterium]